MYELELEKAVEKIKKEKAKKVVIQLPDGIKSEAKEIVDYLRKETKAEIIIWSGSCFGACDTPLEAKRLGADLLIQWGHSPWKY
jgi:2-(3-amino-3-carboxypropyl)histidine synthase